MPVFILGAPHSDASSLATALTASDDFWCSTESHLFYDLVGPDEKGASKIYSAFQNASQNPSFWLPRNKVVYAEFAAYLGLGLDQLFRSRSNKKRWVEASPENTLIAPELSYMFPKARFLTILRDGRDVVSLMVERGSTSGTNEGFTQACKAWRIYAERLLEFQEKFPQKVLEVRHEQLVHGTRQQMARISSFLSSSDGAAIARYLGAEVASFPSRLWEKWDAQHRDAFEKTAGSIFRELGYVLDWEA